MTVFGKGTFTFLVISDSGEILSKFRVSGEYDIAHHFPVKGSVTVGGRKHGVPVLGKNHYRELTAAELEKLGLPRGYKRTNYAECLVPAKLALMPEVKEALGIRDEDVKQALGLA